MLPDNLGVMIVLLVVIVRLHDTNRVLVLHHPDVVNLLDRVHQFPVLNPVLLHQDPLHPQVKKNKVIAHGSLRT